MAEKKPQDDSQHEHQRPTPKKNEPKAKGNQAVNPAHQPIQSKQGKQAPIKAPQTPVSRGNPIAPILYTLHQLLAGKLSVELGNASLAMFYESFALYMQRPQAMVGTEQNALKNYLYGLETSIGSQGTAHDPRQNPLLAELKTCLSQVAQQYPYPQFMLGHYAQQTQAYIEAFQQRGQTQEEKKQTNASIAHPLELAIDLAKIKPTGANPSQGGGVLLGLLAHPQFEEALKKKLQQTALKKASETTAKNTVLRVVLKLGTHWVSTAGLVLAADQSQAPGLPLQIPQGYTLVKEGIFAGDVVKKLYVSAAEAERVGNELRQLGMVASLSPQSLLDTQLRDLVFAFRSRLPLGPIDPNKHKVEEYEGWSMSKKVDFLVKNYPQLNHHEQEQIRALLKANPKEQGLGRLAKVKNKQSPTVLDSVDKDGQKQRYWHLQTKKQQLERSGEKLSISEQAELDDLEEYFNLLDNAHKHSISRQMYLRLKQLEKRIYPTQGITNLNDNDSVSSFGVYAIYINQQLIYKFGKANLSETNSVANPYSQKIENIPVRIQLQLRRLRRAYPTLRITYQLIHKLGYVSTKRAKEIEDDYIFGHYYENKDVPEGNKESFTPRYFRKYLQKKGSSDPHNYSKQ